MLVPPEPPEGVEKAPEPFRKVVVDPEDVPRRATGRVPEVAWLSAVTMLFPVVVLLVLMAVTPEEVIEISPETLTGVVGTAPLVPVR